jgi:hypothetical protein
MLTSAEFTAKHIYTTAKIQFEERDGGWSIHTIDAPVSDITLRGTSAEWQEELPAFASPVRRRYPSASQIRLLVRLF